MSHLQEQVGPGSLWNREVLKLNYHCRHHAPQISPNSLDFNCSILWLSQVCCSGSGNSHPALNQTTSLTAGAFWGRVRTAVFATKMEEPQAGHTE